MIDSSEVKVKSLQKALEILNCFAEKQPLGVTEISEKYGMKTTAIVTMEEVVEHLYNKPYKGKVIIDDKLKAAIDAYYDQYGVK